MSKHQTSLCIGSDAWLGASQYQPDSELHARATSFFQAVNWESLTTVASRHHNGVDCKLTEKFSVGHFNMTRRINFEDGTSWVARLRFPTDEKSQREGLPYDKVMEIEVASMKVFKYV